MSDRSLHLRRCIGSFRRKPLFCSRGKRRSDAPRHRFDGARACHTRGVGRRSISASDSIGVAHFAVSTIDCRRQAGQHADSCESCARTHVHHHITRYGSTPWLRHTDEHWTCHITMSRSTKCCCSCAGCRRQHRPYWRLGGLIRFGRRLRNARRNETLDLRRRRTFREACMSTPQPQPVQCSEQILGPLRAVFLAALVCIALLAPNPFAQSSRASFVVPAWAFPTSPAPNPAPKPDSVVMHRVPNSAREYTMRQVGNAFDIPDWFPQSHSSMPASVQYGSRPNARACGYCHLPDGQGRPGNSTLAGLPVDYIVTQVRAFRDSTRLSADAGRCRRPAAYSQSGHATVESCFIRTAQRCSSARRCCRAPRSPSAQGAVV